jgi:hypothetical protein
VNQIVRIAPDVGVGQQVVEDFEVDELIARRQVGAGVELTFVLHHLGQRLVHRPVLGVGLVDRPPIAVVPVIHEPAKDVAVVRNGDHVDAVGARLSATVSEELSIGGGPRASPVTMEQRNGHLRFQPRDAFAQGGLRDAKPAGGLAEPTVSGDRNDLLQMA